jgi:lipid II:glycine glycyltransferase (peptidoglycan interpeptide bridge formation enzyme)
MGFQTITNEQKKEYNSVISHPLQTYEWGQFREKTGTKVIRRGFFDKNTIVSGFQLTIHSIPKTPWTIGYLPKGDIPTKEMIAELARIGSRERCIFIQLEPNVITNNKDALCGLGLVNSAHPLFTKYTFILDLTQTEEDLLKHMHHKARYNIKVAQKHQVEIVEQNSLQAFSEYWQLMEETTKRQKFYAHSQKYHETAWKLFNAAENKNNALVSHLFLAKYKGKVLAAWILFVCKDTLYYPYGASSNEHREVMASNLLMWEAIRFGKEKGLKKFDMWGAMGPDPSPNDPWYGFHTFKQKYGGQHVEFAGSFDLVIDPVLYAGYKAADKLRWAYLRTIKR